MAPPRPLLRFGAIRQLDTFDTSSDEEEFARGRYFQAGCSAGDAVGDLVYINADSVAGTFQVGKVDPTDTTMMPAVGVVHSKSTSTSCLVLAFGIVSATGVVPGSRYFVDTDGSLTATPPLPAAGNYVMIQAVGVALDSARFRIHPSLDMVKRWGD